MQSNTDSEISTSFVDKQLEEFFSKSQQDYDVENSIDMSSLKEDFFVLGKEKEAVRNDRQSEFPASRVQRGLQI